MNIDELWERPKGGSVSWYEQADDEVKAFIDAVVDRTVEAGREPNFRAVYRKVDELFPGRGTTINTITDTIRRAVKERS